MVKIKKSKIKNPIIQKLRNEILNKHIDLNSLIQILGMDGFKLIVDDSTGTITNDIQKSIDEGILMFGKKIQENPVSYEGVIIQTDYKYQDGAYIVTVNRLDELPLNEIFGGLKQ